MSLVAGSAFGGTHQEEEGPMTNCEMWYLGRREQPKENKNKKNM